jgi:tRNA-modifying protein YgfZ
MNETKEAAPSGYLAARDGSAFFIIPQPGYLVVSGEDRVAFLQRQTSNDVRALAPGQAVLTVLTSATARILDVLYLFQEGDSVGVITLQGRGEATYRYLRSRIFFMDKVALSSNGLAQIDLLGPQSGVILDLLGLGAAPQANQIIQTNLQDLPVRLLGLEPSFAPGCRLLVANEAAAQVEERLRQAGAIRLTEESYDVLRVEAGLPAGSHELVEDYTPLEAGLAVAISDKKGCYTGQEVLARQVTYDRVTQSLCGLKLAGSSNAGDKLQSSDDSPAGRITTQVESPRHGRIALAVLKRPFNQPGTVLYTAAAQVEAVVTELPFSNMK